MTNGDSPENSEEGVVVGYGVGSRGVLQNHRLDSRTTRDLAEKVPAKHQSFPVYIVVIFYYLVRQLPSCNELGQ